MFNLPHRVYPIYFNVRRLMVSNGITIGQQLEHYLRLEAPSIPARFDLQEGFLSRWFNTEGLRWLFLFDGLDEIRKDRNKAIELIYSFYKKPQGSKIVPKYEFGISGLIQMLSKGISLNEIHRKIENFNNLVKERL